LPVLSPATMAAMRGDDVGENTNIGENESR